MWRRELKNEILKRKENFKRSIVKEKICKKLVSASQLLKKKDYFQNIMIGTSQEIA